MLEVPAPQQNHLLAALSEKVQNRLFPMLELSSLPHGKYVYESGDTLRHIYFPTDSIVSLIQTTENGESAEVSMIGNEGLVGIPLLMGSDTIPERAVVHSPGTAYRLTKQQLREEINTHGELEHVLQRYTLSLMKQMAQMAVCNRHHTIDQQLCRWLLLSLDRLSSNCLIMTHELISNMLGVRRESITEAAGKLQKQGIIECHRGAITVLDRARLEMHSCECYEIVKFKTDHILC